MASNDFKKGIYYSAIGKYSNVIIQIAVNAALSRILTPTDYGVVAIVQIFLVFFQMLADMGFGPAIIQNKELTKFDISVIFKFSIYLAIGLSILFMFLGKPVSIFYDDRVYIPVFIVLGLSVFFFSLIVVPKNLLLKQKDFKTVNIVEIYAGIAKGITSIVLALLGASYYSIIIGGIVQAGVSFVSYYSKNRISPRVVFNWEPIRKIFAFSRNQFTFNFINYFSRNFDSILIGRVFNPTQLGYYNKSYQISLYPNQILAGVINPVIQPILSEYENDKELIKNVYLRITRILANMGVPLSVFCFFAGEEIILFLFGNQWGGSVQSFQILAVSIWLQMIASSTGSIYQSANRTDLLLISGLQSMILNVISIAIGVWIGTIEAVAFMVVLSFSLNFIVNNYLLMYRTFQSNIMGVLQSLSKPFVIGALELVAFMLLPELNFGVFINLVIKGILFVVVFAIGLVVTGQLKEMIRVIKS